MQTQIGQNIRGRQGPTRINSRASQSPNPPSTMAPCARPGDDVPSLTNPDQQPRKPIPDGHHDRSEQTCDTAPAERKPEGRHPTGRSPRVPPRAPHPNHPRSRAAKTCPQRAAANNGWERTLREEDQEGDATKATSIRRGEQRTRRGGEEANDKEQEEGESGGGGGGRRER